MRQGTSLVTLELVSEIAVSKLVDQLTAAGMQVIRSFDLQTARNTHVDCECPHHGKDECDCQMVVLLVYDEQGNLLTVVAHGKDNKTYFTLVKPTEGEEEARIKVKILQILARTTFQTSR